MDLLIGMLLVSRSELIKENPVEVFLTVVSTCHLFLYLFSLDLMYNFKFFLGK
jgi:hypothetical protein